MKKLILSVVAAAISVGAAMPASAWGFTRCKVAADQTAIVVSNKVLAHNCHAFIVNDGLISKGKEANKTWSEAFPDVHWNAADDSDVFMDVLSNTHYTFKVGKHYAIRTKHIEYKDIDDYLKRIGYKKIDISTKAWGNTVGNNKYRLEKIK